MKKKLISLATILIFSLCQLYCPTYNSGNTTLTQNERITTSNTATFDNNITFDGANYVFTMSASETSGTTTPKKTMIFVNNCTLTNLFMKNVSFTNFGPSDGVDTNNYGVTNPGAGPFFTFGDGCYLSLLKDEISSYKLQFSGNVTLDGNNRTLTIGTSQFINVTSGTLTLRNMMIQSKTNDWLNLSIGGNVIFDNVTFQFDPTVANGDNIIFSNNSFSVQNNVNITGGTLYYTSTNASTILKSSTLIFSDSATLFYNPNGDFQSNLVLTDTTSRLIIDGSTMQISSTGCRLTTGIVEFRNQNKLYSAASSSFPDRGLIWGNGTGTSNPQVNFAAGASLDVETGNLRSEIDEIPIITARTPFVLRHAKYNTYIYRTSVLSAQRAVGTLHRQIANPMFMTLALTTSANQTITSGSVVQLYVPNVITLAFNTIPNSFPETIAQTATLAILRTTAANATLIVNQSTLLPVSKHIITKQRGRPGTTIYNGDVVKLQNTNASLIMVSTATGTVTAADGITYKNIQFISSGTVVAGDDEWVIEVI